MIGDDELCQCAGFSPRSVKRDLSPPWQNIAVTFYLHLLIEFISSDASAFLSFELLAEVQRIKEIGIHFTAR